MNARLPITVFFDTSFWVDLANEKEREAREIIQWLNEHRVRHVISRTVLMELFSKDNVPDKDRCLVERVGHFELEPLKIDCLYGWEILLATGEGRKAAVAELRHLWDLNSEATSLTLMAESNISEDRRTEINNAHAEELRELGLDPKKPETFPNAMHAMVEMIGLPIEIPENPSRDDCFRIAEQIVQHLGPEKIARVKRLNALHAAATKDDPKVGNVAAKKLPPYRVGSSYRDGDRMDEFIRHSVQIDYFQTDQAQINLIFKNENHPINQNRLAARCFRLSNLEDIKTKRGFLKPRDG